VLRHGNSRHIGELAQALSLTPSATSVAASGLVEKGLAVRGRGEEDARKVAIALTDWGKAKVADIDEVVAEVITALWQPLSDAQRQIMLKCSVKATSKRNRLRVDSGKLRADTAYAEGMLMGHNAYTRIAELHRLLLSEVIVLYWLSSALEPVTMSALAAEVLIRPNNLTLLCRNLIRRELMLATPDPTDRRLQLVAITEVGKERVHRVVKDLSEVVLSDFIQSTDAERDCFRAVAKAIVDAEKKRHRFD
jgi:DNA-binding MarR family transcriptional regulator